MLIEDAIYVSDPILPHSSSSMPVLKIMKNLSSEKSTTWLIKYGKKIYNIVHMSTYYFIFLQSVNPAYYGLEGTDSEMLSSYLSR